MHRGWLSGTLRRMRRHFWIKAIGISGLDEPVLRRLLPGAAATRRAPVVEMPLTALDRAIAFQPSWLAAYLTLWLYVGIPPGFFLQLRGLLLYWAWIGAAVRSGPDDLLLLAHGRAAARPQRRPGAAARPSRSCRAWTRQATPAPRCTWPPPSSAPSGCTAGCRGWARRLRCGRKLDLVRADRVLHGGDPAARGAGRARRHRAGPGLRMASDALGARRRRSRADAAPARGGRSIESSAPLAAPPAWPPTPPRPPPPRPRTSCAASSSATSRPAPGPAAASAAAPATRAHHAAGAAGPGAHPHPLPARAQRLPARRPRQEHLPELRPGARLRRRLPPALRRHQPREGRAGVRRRHHRGGALAGLRLERRRHQPPLLRQQLLRLHVPRRRGADRAPAWPTSTSRAPRRCAPTAATSTRPAPTARSATARRPRTWRACARCATARMPTARRCCARRSTWPRPNINLRDPALYRIKRATHHNTGDRWCIYPMYTYAHPIEDALESITHSICTLEFEDQRPFYDWLLEHLADARPAGAAAAAAVRVRRA